MERGWRGFGGSRPISTQCRISGNPSNPRHPRSILPSDPDQTANVVKDKLGLWLLSAPAYDVAGALWNTNTPIAERVPPDALAPLLAIAPDAPILLDAVYADQDQEYLDARALDRLAAQ